MRRCRLQALIDQHGGADVLHGRRVRAPASAPGQAKLAAQPATPIADEVAGYDMLYSSGTTGPSQGHQEGASEGNPIDVPNPFLKLLCADMCGMASGQHLSVAGAALSRGSVAL